LILAKHTICKKSLCKVLVALTVLFNMYGFIVCIHTCMQMSGVESNCTCVCVCVRLLGYR